MNKKTKPTALCGSYYCSGSKSNKGLCSTKTKMVVKTNADLNDVFCRDCNFALYWVMCTSYKMVGFEDDRRFKSSL